MSVNISKTELLVINSKKTYTELKIEVGNEDFSSKKEMNILGVIFDHNLTWSSHIKMAIKKTKSVIYGLKRLQSYLDTNELLNLVTSLGHSKLYYGSPVWLSRELHKINQKALLRASTDLIKSCFKQNDLNLISFNDIHELTDKATPLMFSDYSQAMMLKTTYNNARPELVWMKLQMNFRENRRSGAIFFGNGSRTGLGRFNFGNRVQHISSKLPPRWEQMTRTRFKEASKNIFLRH